MAKKELPPDVLEFFREQGRIGGKAGGGKGWEKLTAEQRSARAKKASLAAAKARTKKAKERRRAAAAKKKGK